MCAGMDMKVAVLGEGVTAGAVRDYLARHNMTEVPVSEASIIVASPGIPPAQFPTTEAEIISEIELAYRIVQTHDQDYNIIGITGTNGKTTVASGLAHIFNTQAFGNIGMPFISQVDQLSPNVPIILELSSYQIFTSPTLVCNTSVILNITQDHVAWHTTFEQYQLAKLGLIRSGVEHVYVPQDVVDLEAFRGCGAEVHVIDALDNVAMPNLVGGHNHVNAAVMVDIAQSYGLSKDQILERLMSFTLPPFRCQKVYESNERVIINDSKATNMDATLSAVRSFSPCRVLILAGEAKGTYTAEWAEQIAAHCDYIYAAGGLVQNKALFPEWFQQRIEWFSSLKDVTDYVVQKHQGTILFSPSAASFDEFSNYIERGEAFSRYVQDCV
jgi:UDP-N-acetylmuramoylalanine--D-glutamate ligase